MSDTILRECKICHEEADCINGICLECCLKVNRYDYKIERKKTMPNTDERNKKANQYIVRVYFTFHTEYNFPARDMFNAREIAKRIITEGAWIVKDECEEFYPTHLIFKCKVIKA